MSKGDNSSEYSSLKKIEELNNSEEEIELELVDKKPHSKFNKKEFEEYFPSLKDIEKYLPKMNQNRVNATAPSAENETVLCSSIQMIQDRDLATLINSLPEYSPGANLSTFVTSVESLLTHLHGKLLPNQAFVFNTLVLSKIKDGARDFLSFHGKTGWPEIKIALLERYGDQRNETILQANLQTQTQNRNEGYMEFCDRILNALNDLLQHVSLHISDTKLKSLKIEHYQTIATKTYINGLNNPYFDYLSHFEINTIDEAVRKCRTYDQKQQERQYALFLKNVPLSKQNASNVKSNTEPIRPTNQLFYPQFNSGSQFLRRQSQPQNFQSGNQIVRQLPANRPTPFPGQHQQTPKPFGNIHSTPKPIHYPTNKQVFGPPQRKPSEQFKPTPMSINTTNTFRPRHYQSSNHFKTNPNIPRNFTSQELFNHEIEQPDLEEHQNLDHFSEGSFQEDFLYEQPEENLNSQYDSFENENFQQVASNSKSPT